MAAPAGDLSIRIRITADGSQAIVSLRRTEDATRNLGNTSRQAAGGLDSVAKSLAGVAAGYLSLQGLERLVSSLVKITDEAARLDAAYNMIFGSAGAAADALSRVTEMANRAGINSSEAAKAFQSLAAAAQGTALEAQAFDIFESVAIAMSKLGKDSFDTAGALKALEQMISKGNVQAEELRGQLGDRLPGAFKLTADAMGVSTAELNKMLVLGQVTAEEMLPKLADELNRVYGSAAFAETVAADWARFGNVISGPGGLAETVNKAIGLNEFLMDVLKDVTAAATAMNTALNNGQVASALAGWSEAISKAAAYAGQMAVGLYALADEWYQFVQALSGADADQIRTLWEDLTMLVGRFSDAMLGLPDNLRGVFLIIIAELDIVAETFGAHWDRITAGFDLAGSEISLAFVSAFAAIRKAVGEAVLWIGKKLEEMTADMAEFARLASDLPGVGGFATEIAEQLEGLGTRLRDSTLAFMWEQHAAANQITQSLREEVDASKEAMTAAQTRLDGLGEYARQARETAADLMNLTKTERERARFLREWDAEAERIFSEMDAFNSSPSGTPSVATPSLTDDQASALQSLIDQYVPGAKAARTLAEAQEVLNAAVAAGQIPQEEATRIMAAMRDEMERKVASTNKAAAALAEYADRVGGVLGLNERQKATLLEILPAIDAAADKYGVMREVIVGLIAQESGFDKLAKSSAGAMGLMQIMPGTAQDIARQIGVSAQSIYSDLNTHIEAGTYYLTKYIEQFGSLEAGLRAYNAGPGAVEASKGFKETNEYVEKVTGNIEKLVPIAGSGGASLRDVLGAAAKEAAEKLAELEKELDDLSETWGTGYGAQRVYERNLSEINALHKSGRMNAEEYADALNDIRLEYQASQGPMAEYLAELERSIGGMEEFGVEIMDSLVSNIADALADGKLEFRDFVDDIKGYLAEIAAKKIVLTFAASLGFGGSTAALAGGSSGVAGVAGSAGSTVSGLSGLGTLGNLGSMLTSNSLGSTLGLGLAQNSLTSWVPTSGITNLMGVSNWMLGGSTIGGALLGSALFDGGYSDIGSSIGSAAGSVIGSMILPGIGTVLGSLLGGTGGGFLGSLFGDDTPKFGGYQTSFSGLGFEDNVKSAGSFGMSFGLSGKTDNIDASEYQDTLDGLAAVSNTLANFYGGELETLVENALNAQRGDYTNWGKSLDEAFSGVFGAIIDTAADVDTEVDGMGRILDVVIEASGGLQALGTSAADMTAVIQGGIEIATYTTKLFNTEVGKLMGLGIEFETMAESAAALTWYVQAFWQEGETSASMIERFVTNLQALDAAVTMTGGSLEDLWFSSMDLMIIAEDLRASIEDLGLTMSDFATLQTNFWNAAYTEAERAAVQAESAREAIAAWNAEMGFVGESTIDTLAELRAYLESLDEYSADYNDLYVSAINASGAFISLDEALRTLAGTATETASTLVDDFIDSITPDYVKQNAALTEMTALFAEWGMQIPVTSEALYALIQANVFSNAQLEILAKNADTLGLAWAAIAAAQEEAIADLTAAYNEAVASAKSASSDRIAEIRAASSDRIDALREASAAALDALREHYNALVEALNTELDAAQDALKTFSDVVDAAGDALRSLTEQADGIDETRQRALAEARAAIEQYADTGTLPDDITDIIGRLDTVDPNDFATRDEWLAAIAENAAVLSELEGIGATRVSEAERQIALLEAQIEQAAEQYEAEVAAEEERLERLIAAEEASRDALIAAEEQALETLLAQLKDEYDTQVEAIRSGDDATIAAIQQTNALLEELLASVDGLDLTIQSVNAGADATQSLSIPGFASGGTHTGGLRIVGELGPELEYTGPSHVAPNSDLGGLFREGNSDVAEAVQALRDELRDLRALQSSQSNLIQALLKIHKRWDGEGLPPDRADYLRTLAEATETAP